MMVVMATRLHTIVIRWVTSALLIVLVSGCSTIAKYEAQQEKNRRVAETHVELGVGYLQQNQPEYALEKLKKAIDADSSYAPAHSAIAMTYEQLLKPELADYHYQEAISLNPEDGGLYNNYGVFLCKQGEFKKAEEYFLKAIDTPRYRTPELAYENAGSCVKRIPDMEKAEKYLTRALEKNPELPVALINMAEIRYQQEKFLSSRGFLQRFEAVSRHTAESLWLGIKIERKLGDENAVSRYAKLLQSQFPKSEQYKLMLNSLGENQS
ncbi:MAG: type IV pilus biogenesis/stability protein PilW [Gammaproteobacteria bacterium]|jgi:type IV pilus assembly protein PilF